MWATVLDSSRKTAERLQTDITCSSTVTTQISATGRANGYHLLGIAEVTRGILVKPIKAEKRWLQDPAGSSLCHLLENREPHRHRTSLHLPEIEANDEALKLLDVDNFQPSLPNHSTDGRGRPPKCEKGRIADGFA